MRRALCIYPLVSLVLIVALSITKVALGEGSYANLGTSNALNGSNDALTWDQGAALTIDSFGKYILLVQERSGITNFTWSNDSGAVWVQSGESNPFLTRGSIAYDSNNDKLHVIWSASDSNDGIIYRRYGITRDGSNNITAILREDSGAINLQLDTSGSCKLGFPSAIWLDDGSTNGILVAVWSKDTCSGVSQVRGSMRRLSLTAADGQAGNWVALDGVADTFSSEAPAVAADKIYNDTQGGVANSIKIRGGSGARKDDLYVIVQESASIGADEVLAYRGVWDGTDKDWSGGWQSPVIMGLADHSSGYNLKYQLLSKAVTDPVNDRLYVSFARWQAGGAGDTVSFAYLNGTDVASSIYDAYSAQGTHSYAPTMSLAFDETLGRLVVSYIESTTNGDNGSINYKTFDGTTLSSAVRFYTSPGGAGGANGSADIPVMYPARVNGKLLFLFRVNGSLPPSDPAPHTVYFGTELLPTPTPTPSPTPIATPTSGQNTASSNSSSGVHTPGGCSALATGSAPRLFLVNRKGNDATLWIVPGGNPYTGLVVWYGEEKSTTTYADLFDQSYSSGMIKRTIHHLQSNQAYSFRVQSRNDCRYSDSSATLSIGRKNGLTMFDGKFIRPKSSSQPN